MSLELMIYLASVVDGLRYLMALICFLAILASFIGGLNLSVSYGADDEVKSWFAIKWGIIALITASTILVFTPSEKTIYAIAAVNVSKKITESKDFKTLYDKTYQLIEKKLDEAAK